MEIRIGMRIETANGLSKYEVQSMDGLRGRLWGFSNSTNNYSSVSCSSWSVDDFERNISSGWKVTYYPYKVGDIVVALKPDSGIVVGEKYKLSEGIKPWSSGNIDGCKEVVRINGNPYYTNYFRPAFSWEIKETYFNKEDRKEKLKPMLEVGDRVSVSGTVDEITFTGEIGIIKKVKDYSYDYHIKFDTKFSDYLYGEDRRCYSVYERNVVLIGKEKMNDLDKMLAETENYLNVMSSGPLKSTNDSKLSPSSEMKTTISGLKPRSKKVCYTSTQVKIAM